MAVKLAGALFAVAVFAYVRGERGAAVALFLLGIAAVAAA